MTLQLRLHSPLSPLLLLAVVSCVMLGMETGSPPFSAAQTLPPQQTLPQQTLPGTLQPQGPITAPTIPTLSAPTSGLPANIITPLTTNQLAPGIGAIGRPGFTSAGRGLPGMPGGPPLKAPMGSQDPSTDYMRPPSVGPLFCDPAINISC